MGTAAISLREDYWDSFEIQNDDVDFLYNHLLEAETPMTPDELILSLVRDRLKILAIEEGKTLQSLIGEAFNDLFAKYGKPEIAPKD